MKILECKGNDYTIGLQIGTYFREILRKHASAYENALQEAETAEHIQKELQILKENMPGIYDELRGRSEGSGLSIEMITLMSSLEITSRSSSCTTVIVKQPGGRILFSHNEDEDDFTADNSAVLAYRYDDLDLYAYTNAWKLPGSADGWNSAGMVFTSNYLFYEKADFSRVSRYIACKAVYHSRTLEEAVEAVRQLKTASPFSINILDTRTDRAVNIEKDLDACYITE
nr:C45 family peptidase [Solobacterium sp.]